MAEIEIGGIKFTGGKMFAVFTALSTAAGIVWGASIFWQDYMSMKSKIESYISPDLSHIEQGLAVQEETMSSIKYEIEFLIDDVRDLKHDVRDEQKRLYQLETQTQRDLLEVRKIIRESIQEALENPLAE